MKQIDIKHGMKFGKLTVLNFKSLKIYNRKDPKKKYKRYLWECICECGVVKSVLGGNLVSGNTSSCGCAPREAAKERNFKHGMTNSRIWLIWRNMRARCYNVDLESYENYGGRGIGVCEDWLGEHGFSNFYRDMIKDYEEWLTIDRIDNDMGYCKENCRWVSYSIQGFNQRKRSTNSSGRTGVYWNKRNCKWEAKIGVDGKLLNIYSGDSFEEAVKYREAAELEYFGVIREEDY